VKVGVGVDLEEQLEHGSHPAPNRADSAARSITVATENPRTI